MWIFTVILLCFTTWFGSFDMFHEGSSRQTYKTQEEIKIDQSKIRYGDYSAFKKGDKVATVRSTEIYSELAPYKILKKENVTEGSARWEQLMQEATSLYKTALKHNSAGYTIIIEEGGISGYDAVDITRTVINSL